MAFAEHLHADQLPPKRRHFDTLSLDDVSGPSIAMHDPQQPELSMDPSPLVIPGQPPMRAMVEPMVFENMRHTRVASESPVSRQPLSRAASPADMAQAIVTEARSTARTMLAQARDVIAAERAQAIERGYQEGLARGAAEADAETAGLIATCEKIGVNVMEERARVLDENEADIVELAISIARRIVNAAIDVDETLVIEACRGAMRKAFQRGALQVLAHPADLQLLRDAGPELAAELGGVEHLDFIEERRIDRGSVIVRTPAGEIDGTIAGKADKIEMALREGIEQRRAERRAAA